MNYKKTIWFYLSAIVNFLVPNWLFEWLKKNPFKPLIIVLILYLLSSLKNDYNFFPLPCISILGTNCIMEESPNEIPYRGFY